MTVYAFDFDGTITKRDTLIEFIRFACGTRRMMIGFMLYSPLLVLMKFKLFPNWRAKQLLFSHFFKGMTEQRFNELCTDFARQERNILRPAVIELMHKIIDSGGKVVVISASMENWVRPFFTDFGDSVTVSGTKIDVRSGVVTGNFLTMNCYGEEKVKRVKALFPNRRFYKLVAFGDSAGDKALFRYADSAFLMVGGRWHKFKGDDDLVDLPDHSGLPGEIIRFGIVGVTATAIQYGVYLLLLLWLSPRLANTAGYLISFAFNFVASTKFTFHVKANARHGAGFAFSHLINYLLQTLFLSLFLWLGMEKHIALLPVFCICVPVNFVLVRFFLTKK